jgi:hypothetical protein
MSLFGGQTIEVACDVDIEQTQRSFHAYAVPDGIDIGPGDAVLVHGAPTVGFGEHVTCRCTATVTRAGLLRRLWTEFRQIFELTELYEVGFQPMAESEIQPKYLAERVSKERGKARPNAESKTQPASMARSVT